MKRSFVGLAGLSLLSGCAVFKAPPQKAGAPTVATGVYQSKAEQWADQALADQSKTDKERIEKDLGQLDRK